MPAIQDLTAILKYELDANDLLKLRSVFEEFVKGTSEERAAAEAIAANVKDAIRAYMEGQLGRADLEFVLENSRKGTIALVDAKALRLKKASIRIFFRAMSTWLLTRI